MHGQEAVAGVFVFDSGAPRQEPVGRSLAPSEGLGLARGELLVFGGATLAMEFYAGWYLDPDTGLRLDDVSKKYFVALPREEVGRLRSLLRHACVVFRQKCIYLSVAGDVEFVGRPSHATG